MIRARCAYCGRWILSMLFLFLMPVPYLQAGDSAISSVLETTKALVDIQSVNAALVGDKPHGFIDKATGQILVMGKVRRVGFSRNGSGIIIDPKGTIVTNSHIVRGAGGLAVTLYDGTHVPVKGVYLVPGVDVAFLKIDPPAGLFAIPFGDPERVSNGTSVFTVGHSIWLKGTVLGGKVLGIQRGVFNKMPLVTALKLNFDMEKGDSGCPVLNNRGELLGIIAASFYGRKNVTLAISSEIIGSAYRDYREKQG